ncbi:glycine oxidase ThiO [Sanguibacter antarcticus]|uniref:glycine oxidase n=1 Tax=Sanguibacter antarcticus TaxID=372484 RepID=A0A2A9E4F8_9MICO|nr:glycine oxidase ThiO [Sanguibacter antarcticus]PFG33937.1 glycine oxidase [Sanguibacter antarcticus]
MRALTVSTPPPATTVSDVLVLGGGIIGAVASWRAACLGLSVTCLDPSPGSGATWAAAGMLAPVTEASFGEPDLTALCVDSARRWPAFAAELEHASGLDVGLAESGTLTVSYDQGDAQEAGRLHALHGMLGLASERLTLAEARVREPFLGSRLSAAYWVSGDHQVDPRATHRALMSIIDGRPGTRSRVVRSAAVRLVRSPAGEVVGAVDATGATHAAGLVVLAAGADSPGLLGAVPEVVVPTRAVRGQTIRLDSRGVPEFGLQHVVRGTVQMRPVYVVPRPGGEVVVGATSEERTDHRTPAGSVYALLRDARALVPGVDELDFREVTTGLRPGTPDNVPIIGQTDVPGLAVATGHYRNGVLLAPLTAAAIDALLSGDDALTSALPAALASADPRRFSCVGAHA